MHLSSGTQTANMKQNTKDCNDRRPNFIDQIVPVSFTSLFTFFFTVPLSFTLSYLVFTIRVPFPLSCLSSLFVALFPIRVLFNTLCCPWPWYVTYRAGAKHRTMRPEYAIEHGPDVLLVDESLVKDRWVPNMRRSFYFFVKKDCNLYFPAPLSPVFLRYRCPTRRVFHDRDEIWRIILMMRRIEP